MADVSKLKVNNDTYDLKDATARTDASNVNTKLTNSTISGTYTAGTETLELAFSVGSVS